MAPLLDNLVAVVVGTTLLIALVLLQTRQRQVAVDETVHHIVRGHIESAMEVLTSDVDNMMNRVQADAAFPPGYPFRLDTATVTGMMGSTRQFAFPSRIDTSTTNAPLVPALVVYRTVDPTGGPDSVRVGETWRRVFQLQRATALAGPGPAPPPLPNLNTLAYAAVSSGVIMEFQAVLVGENVTTGAAEVVRDGMAPAGLNSVQLSLAGGIAKVDSLAGGQVNPRQLNATRLSVTRRPVNL